MRGKLPVLVATGGLWVSARIPRPALKPEIEAMKTTVPPALALRPREAAKVLGISPRLLWNLSAPRGPIPCTRLGSKGGCVLYRPADLDAWLLEAQDQQRPPAAETVL